MASFFDLACLKVISEHTSVSGPPCYWMPFYRVATLTTHVFICQLMGSQVVPLWDNRTMLLPMFVCIVFWVGEYVLMANSRASCMFFKVALSSHPPWLAWGFHFPTSLFSLVLSCLFANRATLLSRNDVNPSLNSCPCRASALQMGLSLHCWPQSRPLLICKHALYILDASPLPVIWCVKLFSHSRRIFLNFFYSSVFFDSIKQKNKRISKNTEILVFDDIDFKN